MSMVHVWWFWLSCNISSLFSFGLLYCNALHNSPSYFHLRMGECREMSIMASFISLYTKNVSVSGIFTYKWVIHHIKSREYRNRAQVSQTNIYGSLCQAHSFIHHWSNFKLMLNRELRTFSIIFCNVSIRLPWMSVQFIHHTPWGFYYFTSLYKF